MQKYEHLSDSERRRIERLLTAGFSFRGIARALGRSPGTIVEELARNQVHGRYEAKKAAHKAYVNRKYSKVQSMKVVQNRQLQTFVEEKLEENWSPEMIAGRIEKIERHLPHLSPKAVYKFVYSVYGRKLEKHLYRKRVKSGGGPKRGRKAVMDGRVSIEKRPKHVEKRKQFGHFEGDFIESGRDGTGSLLVLVERKTRYPFLAYIESRKTDDVNTLIFQLLKNIPLASLTLDNDVSFKKHKELSTLLGVAVFFCHPYASHEKGTVENRNGRIREFIPKRTDLSTVPLQTFWVIQEKLRDLPMECLGWQTPREAWEKEMKKAAECGGMLKTACVLKANRKCSA